MPACTDNELLNAEALATSELNMVWVRERDVAQLAQDNHAAPGQVAKQIFLFVQLTDDSLSAS
jgi:hypothetical protein